MLAGRQHTDDTTTGYNRVKDLTTIGEVLEYFLAVRVFLEVISTLHYTFYNLSSH